MNFQNLQLPEVLKKVAHFALLDDAKELIINEIVIFNPLIIKEKINYTKDGESCFKNEKFSFKISSQLKLKTTLDKIAINAIVEQKDIVQILLFFETIKLLKNSFKIIDKDNSLKVIVDSLFYDNNLHNYITNITKQDGSIKEDATEKLRALNKKIIENDQNISGKISTFLSNNTSNLQESLAFNKNDRVVFLVKDSFKNKYRGYQYGKSSSGLATYVEPDEFVGLNTNRINLQEEYHEEIIKIYQDISNRLYYLYAELSQTYESIILLDSVFAKISFGKYNNGTLAIFNEDSDLFLKDIAHPLIDENKVVTNTYNLKEDVKGIIISGTNTGGKTVSLKQIGLSVLMTYLGIPLISEKAFIPFFNNIYVDIDDNQSIKDSLSTFSSHVKNINDILEIINEKSLVLIDELISGTDPKEAEAISLAILDELRFKKCKFVITTHYNRIKEYGLKYQDILLSSVGFDYNNLKPTYKYHENVAGNSNALEVAIKYITNPYIIKNAKKYLKENENQSEILLNKLTKELAESEELIKKNKEENTKLQNLINEYNNKINAFNVKISNKEKEAYNKLNTIINSKIKQIEEEYNLFKKEQNKQSVITKLENIIEIEDEVVKDEELKINDYVSLKNGHTVGILTNINGNNCEVVVHGVSIKTKLTNLQKINKKEKIVKKYIPTNKKSVPSSINVIGKNISEAIDELNIYLSNASGSRSEVKIIHGVGTLKLKKGIINYLKTLKYVKSYKDGDFDDGGIGVTIVKFK